jgi:hypothetical protein
MDRHRTFIRSKSKSGGSVSDLLESSGGLKRKLISIDKQNDDNIMHHNRFRKANSLSN